MSKKAYWIATYRSITDPEALAAYAKAAAPVFAAAGAKYLARGLPAVAWEEGLLERAVLIEFDSVEQAIALHDGADYQAALALLGDGAVRDIRVVEAA